VHCICKLQLHFFQNHEKCELAISCTKVFVRTQSRLVSNFPVPTLKSSKRCGPESAGGQSAIHALLMVASADSTSGIAYQLDASIYSRERSCAVGLLLLNTVTQIHFVADRLMDESIKHKPDSHWFNSLYAAMKM